MNDEAKFNTCKIVCSYKLGRNYMHSLFYKSSVPRTCFLVYPDELLNSKHFNYDSLIITIGGIFREFSIIPKSTQETKINQILKLKRRINELVKELKSTLI